MDRDKPSHLPMRLASLGVVVSVMLGLLALRLWQLQVLQGEHYAQLAEGNRLRIYRTAAPRGLILDRRGVPLVANRPSFSVSILPLELGEPDRVLPHLAALLGVPEGEIRRRLAGSRTPPFEPVRIRRDVGLRVVTAIEERRTEMRGVVVEAEPVRVYRYRQLAAHVLGYLGEISAQELAVLRPRGYRAGDLIGKAGIERHYDAFLRGDDGEQVVEVDASGRPLRVLREQTARPGRSVVTTLDRELQALAEAELAGRAGAIVAMDPRNGEILAMASNPTYDPNLFAAGISEATWARLSEDPRHPLLNRAVASAYEPGSVFKVVTGLAALADGKATAGSRFYCSGSLTLGRWVFRDLAAHGNIDFLTGVAQSCNVMFWQLGRALGPDRLRAHATMLGLGERTGVDLPSEAEGIIPSREYKQTRWREPWYPGDTLNMAIGQGFVLATPLQIARMAAAIANGGQLVQPRLVRAVVDGEGRVVRRIEARVQRRVDLPPAALQAMRRGLEAVVVRGTGRAAAVPGVAVAGKTGSAETPRGRPHAWFVGYAPADRPQIAVAVLIEHGYRGGLSAAPIARRIVEAWYSASAQHRRPAAGRP
ncbi:MAG: penicillin-binding protein 2 [Armatimonadota bacterium]|nr:penicillin-binding protein 2 [Armatimonadota bacterium]MDR5698100.1 penicillin-binding protein 2 [Armatimonadota bacterium]